MDDFSPVHLSELIWVTHRHDGSVIAASYDDVHFMHWNINHLTNKLSEVELRIASYPGIIHVVAISESWLTPNNCSTYQIRNYQAFHNVRQGKESGGISIFVHKSLCFKNPIILVNTVTSEFHHFLIIEIPSIHINIAVPYKRPEGSTPEFLNDLVKLCPKSPNCLLMGDLNMDQIDTAKHDTLLNLLESHAFGLLNAIDKSAFTRKRSGTIIDIVESNMLNHQYKLSIVHTAHSDHAIIYTSFNRKFDRPSNHCTKSKLNVDAAITMVEQLCDEDQVKCGNELNNALENIVKDCTSTVSIKSDHRIRNTGGSVTGSFP